ncbi:carbohydrate-binding module family 21 protein [Mucor lusitanicus]|uniref:Carbohydrate-binding module family 21 protein n=2 Tax=Mucor circinelloides f. lusitanicus TaxID=29924 RepID=A0A168IK48_MUCCL|nr:carbohydrate-binding module family 21 protein [Mucor lusitanicus]OAD00043.1 carbohydrate-binding module family 21 protein [Mucor lusitanicus CBS 277.49]
MINRKRVSLNRRSSSLLLDYSAMLQPDGQGQQEQQPQEPSDYTRQLVASALSLPSSVHIETKVSAQLPPSPPSSISTPQQKHGADKIDLPQFRLKSSLKNPKSASAPCSPTIGLKSVRFHTTNLEDVCLFRKAQTPLAISQKNIFWANDDNDSDSDSDSSSSSSSSSDEDEQPARKAIKCSNWPTRLSDIIDRKNKIIRVDKNTIRLQDDDFIVGKVSVRNLNYHKTVIIRYTFDYWESVDNIQATYQESSQKNDIFAFKIHVPANAATLYFAINYKVGSEDHWDNNDGRNYQVDISLSKPNHARKKASKSQAKSRSDLPQPTSLTASQDTLKSRYDFSQAKNIIPATQAQTQTQTSSSSSSASQPSSTIKQTFAMPIPIRRSVSTSPTGLSCHSPLASSPSFMDLNSQSYMELVNKYCFYSTSPSRSPMSING